MTERLERIEALLLQMAERQIAANAEAIAQLRGEAAEVSNRVEVLEEAA